MKDLIVVRGGGDIATGTIMKLYQCGFSVLVLEIPNPSAIRRNVAFCEAVYQGSQTVEDVTCYLAKDSKEAAAFLEEGKLTMLIDPEGECLKEVGMNGDVLPESGLQESGQPENSLQDFRILALVDGILAKKNLGTSREMAPITVALGPGFVAGEDVDAVIETKRGHNLGRVIYEGSAAPNTGVPGKIAGFDKERVIHSPAEGILRNVASITDTVKKGQTIAIIENETEKIPVEATLDGLLRGLIRDGYPVTRGFKIADIDPRADEYNNCFTISDKARTVAGGALEAILHLKMERGL